MTPPAFVSLATTTISLDPLLTTGADVAVYTVSVLVRSTLYPSTVLDQTYTFQVDLQHCTVNSFTIAAISNVSMRINDPPMPLTFSAAVLSSLVC